MSKLLTSNAARQEHGFTLIEVLVSMVLGLILSLGAFMMLEFTTQDVAHTTARVHADQTARVALEDIMLQLHSVCVAAKVTPIEPLLEAKTQDGYRLRYISEFSPLNSNHEPTSELPTVHLHELIFTEPSGSTQGTLIEKSWPSTGKPPGYKFNYTGETPTTRLLLKGIQATEVAGKKQSVFQYFRYYQSSEGASAKLGQLYPLSIEDKTEKESEQIAKVTVRFTLSPEAKEAIGFGHDRPVALEDSASFRLATASETVNNQNESCSAAT